ncbi:MAG TPA: MFS transporter, partial [Candidatus Alistipes intestinipullorum]|nr:MFS transporter [Candidatus Alistipes intestinipullorum]
MNRKTSVAGLLPVLFSFFVMGFVDVVGVATSYVKSDFALNDRIANLLPMMVFLWFAVCSLPTGMLMGRIGRKRTVMASAAVTFVAMLLPMVAYSFPVVLTAFALLGIGNTMLQVSLNPLLADVAGASRATSMLTLGQFIKAICSMLGPVLVGVAAGVWGNWRLIFLLYAGKSSVSCPLKPKRFYPLKTFNNAPLKSLDRWGYYYFSLFPSV